MHIKNLIQANLEARNLEEIEPSSFALKNPMKWESEFLREVLNQYQILKKITIKIPSWATNKEIIGASLLNIEQCSSDETGSHKFRNHSGVTAIDLTGGFGVDSYFLSRKFERIISVESYQELQEVVRYNFEKLNIKNTEFVNKTAEDFLKDCETKFDFIYLDPDRRNKANKKLVLLEECSPNLIEIQSKLLSLAPKVLVKYSPLLDIQLALKKIDHVSTVEIVALKNEVKELLFTISEDANDTPLIISTNITKEKTESFSHTIEEEKNTMATYHEPLCYLYEPNAAIMKSGAFNMVAVKFDIFKIAQHSHYYTSDNLVQDFPGKTFKVEKIESYNSKVLKPLKNRRFNVLARNFPLNSVTICKKHHLNTGGDKYLIFTQNLRNEKIILTCIRTF